MQHVLTLDDWVDGKSPDQSDLASWSNLVRLRSLQVENPVEDPISLYFSAQWIQCPDKTLATELFERTFSAYGLSVQLRLLQNMVSEENIRPVDFLKGVVPHGQLYRHLLHRTDIWDEMSPVQLNDSFYSFFHNVVDAEQFNQGLVHPCWSRLAKIVDPKERLKFFNSIVGPRIRNEFGFLSEDGSRFPIASFHRTLAHLCTAWNIHPAQVVYAMLRNDPSTYRNLEEYREHIEPYANDIRNLLELTPNLKNQRLLEKLPESNSACTLDAVVMFALMGDADNLFWDHTRPMAVADDPDAAAGLAAALSEDNSLF